jgi:chromosome segregation ATPase
MEYKQYNFKIEETFKDRLDTALIKSGASNKSEFLAVMLTAYETNKTSHPTIDLDISKYEHINTQAKDSIADAFKHILSLLDANYSTTKHEKIQVYNANKALEAKELDYQSQFKQLEKDSIIELNTTRLEANERITNAENQVNQAKNQAKELETKNEELHGKLKELYKKLETTGQIATQVQAITDENKELRSRTRQAELNIKRQELENTKELKTLRESNFKQEMEIRQQKKEYTTLQKDTRLNTKTQEEKLEKLNKDITESQANLNKALGKLEILGKKD